MVNLFIKCKEVYIEIILKIKLYHIQKYADESG